MQPLSEGRFLNATEQFHDTAMPGGHHVHRSDREQGGNDKRRDGDKTANRIFHRWVFLSLWLDCGN
ncbi:hypothetical protein WK07_04335 [Burkholderia multivorans]|nr:hypothetical protein WK07_04335 [Burkholderia multivorans]